jgi:hypothetical protein
MFDNTINELKSFVGKMGRKVLSMEQQILKLSGALEVLKGSQRVKTTEEEIDEIPGRRIMFNLSGTQTFTATQRGNQGDPITMQVSQDGPFIWTAYPLVAWKPNAPDNADNLGRWRPVYSWPLPDQVLDDDIIDISWQMNDGGSQRNFQNEVATPVFSRPDLVLPLPKPVIFTPNSVIQFIPTYEAINFGTAPTVDTTGGILRVTLLGYKCANL